MGAAAGGERGGGGWGKWRGKTDRQSLQPPAGGKEREEGGRGGGATGGRKEKNKEKKSAQATAKRPPAMEATMAAASAPHRAIDFEHKRLCRRPRGRRSTPRARRWGWQHTHVDGRVAEQPVGARVSGNTLPADREAGRKGSGSAGGALGDGGGGGRPTAAGRWTPSVPAEHKR